MEYDERLGVPLRWWVQGTMMVASLCLAFVVAFPADALWVVWSITAAAAGIVALAFLTYGAARVQVDGDVFRAGRAQIPLRHLGVATALDVEQSRLVAGQDADARAYLLLRPYVRRAVTVELTDPADPAPYWLVASRHPERVVAALDTARGRLPLNASD